MTLFDGTLFDGDQVTLRPRTTGPPKLWFYVDGDLIPVQQPEDRADQDKFHISRSKMAAVGQRLHPDQNEIGHNPKIAGGMDKDGNSIC